MGSTAAAMSTASTQMNMRIGRDLKKNGDEVFAAIGITASEAVRKLYELAAASRHNPERVLDVLAPEMKEIDESRARAIQTKIEALHRGWSLFDHFYESMGISPSNEETALSDDELKEWAMWEKYGWEEDHGSTD